MHALNTRGPGPAGTGQARDTGWASHYPLPELRAAGAQICFRYFVFLSPKFTKVVCDIYFEQIACRKTNKSAQRTIDFFAPDQHHAPSRTMGKWVVRRQEWIPTPRAASSGGLGTIPAKVRQHTSTANTPRRGAATPRGMPACSAAPFRSNSAPPRASESGQIAKRFLMLTSAPHLRPSPIPTTITAGAPLDFATLLWLKSQPLMEVAQCPTGGGATVTFAVDVAQPTIATLPPFTRLRVLAISTPTDGGTQRACVVLEGDRTPLGWMSTVTADRKPLIYLYGALHATPPRLKAVAALSTRLATAYARHHSLTSRMLMFGSFCALSCLLWPALTQLGRCMRWWSPQRCASFANRRRALSPSWLWAPGCMWWRFEGPSNPSSACASWSLASRTLSDGSPPGAQMGSLSSATLTKWGAREQPPTGLSARRCAA